MNQYEKYKPSGVDWIGSIPFDWELTKLRYLSDIDTGGKNTEDRVDYGLYPFFVRSQTVERINSFSFDGEAILTAGDGVGVAKVFHHYNGKFDFHQRVYMMSHFKNVEGKYLFYYLQANLYKEVLKWNAKSTVDSLRLPMFQSFLIAYPRTIEEQTAIASFLDKKTTQIDKLISNKQKLIELLKEERTTNINEAVSGKGKNWERKKLKYVAKRVQTGSTPPSNEEQYYSEEVNWFTPSDFSENLLLQNSKRKIAELAITDGVVKIFPANSVLFVGIGATLGKVGYIIEPATSNQQINCLSFHSKEEAIFYANYFYSNRPNIIALANAAILAILNQSQMKDIILPIPSSIDELKTTIQYIQTETQRIDDTLSKIEKEIELMQEYRTALISEVVTGKIKVV